MYRSRSALFASLVLLWGCDVVGLRACTAQFVVGLHIEVVAAANGRPVENPVGIARDGDYIEELQGFGNELSGAGERAGTYDIEVAAPGFATWSREDVRVEENQCHVIPVDLLAELVALPGGA